jgi:hypothetical protein
MGLAARPAIHPDIQTAPVGTHPAGEAGDFSRSADVTLDHDRLPAGTTSSATSGAGHVPNTI